MTEQERINESVQKNRNAKSQYLNEVKSKHGCAKCGEGRFYLLDFHHTDPNQKEFALSHSIQKNYSYTRIVAEVNKCIVLCSNCHREFHYLNGVEGGLNALELYLGRDIITLNEVHEEKKCARTKSCCDCGIPISITANRCNSCASKLKITDKPIDRESLKLKIRTESFTSIGKEFNVTDNTIRKWCKHYNLPTLKRIIKSYSSEKWNEL